MNVGRPLPGHSTAGCAIRRHVSERPDKEYFTVAEANAHIETLRRLFGQVMQMRMHLKGLYKSLEAAGFPPNQEDEDEDEDLPPDVTHDRALFLAMAETLRDQIEEILATGCVIKDVESGLVDWPALYEGREIWLCWKYGEQEVGYWHELNSGFAGRRPVSELQQSGDPKSPPRM